MGQYCCCGNRWPKCECDMTGWHPYPNEIPAKDGKYLVRYGDNGGDKNEDEWFFSVKYIEKHGLMYSDKVFEKHWEHETWDDYFVYAWKEIT